MGIGAARALALAAAVMAAGLTCTSTHAADTPIRAVSLERAPLKERIFVFAGADVARHSYFAWTGIVGAPYGRLDEDGLRLRVMGGYGRYRYRTGAVPGGINEGVVSSGELMLGFRRAFEAVIVTAYLGAHVESQRLRAPDPGHPAAGTATGVKVATEWFSRPSPDWIAIAFATASTVHWNYQLRAALAREIGSGVRFGFEAAVLGDARYVEPRVGLFANVALGHRLLTLSSGYLSNSDKGDGAYATVSLYLPY